MKNVRKNLNLLNLPEEDFPFCCPNCGGGANFSYFHHDDVSPNEIGCWTCGWKGKNEDLVTEKEFKNIKRTRLIDKMTKMIKMTFKV